MHRPALSRSVFALLLAACSANDPAATGSGAGTEDSGDADESDGGSPTSADGSTGGVDESTGAEAIDVPARSVRISKVEANPGVAIPIAENGAWVDGSGRNAPLVKNRNTAFRVYLDVDDASWVPRTLKARLTVTQADGRESSYEEVGQIDN